MPDIIIAGAQFNGVPSIDVPKAGGGMATFLDTTIAEDAAAAADILNGKKAYVNGQLITGTGSGGGGSAVLVSKMLTSNGIYYASDYNADGFGIVVVNIPGAGQVFNQLISNPTFIDTSYWGCRYCRFDSVSDNVGTFSCTNTNNVDAFAYRANLYAQMNVTENHVYYFGVTAKLPKGSYTRFCFASGTNVRSNEVQVSFTPNTWQRFEGLITPTISSTASSAHFMLSLNADAANVRGDDIYYIKDGMCVDLTEMFGAGNEPTLDVFREIFPLDSYPYEPLSA